MEYKYHNGRMDSKTIHSPRPGSEGSQNIRFFLQIKVLISCAKIAQIGTNFENHQNWKKNCFLRHFPIFFNLGAILAHQTSIGMFSRSWRIFWHHLHPWGHVNSGDISFLVQGVQTQNLMFWTLIRPSKVHF